MKTCSECRRIIKSNTEIYGDNSTVLCDECIDYYTKQEEQELFVRLIQETQDHLLLVNSKLEEIDSKIELFINDVEERLSRLEGE